MKTQMLVGVLTGTLVLLCLCIRGVVGAAAPMSKAVQSSPLPVPTVPAAQQQTLTSETSFTLYGPRRFDRVAGPPRNIVEQFELPADAVAPYSIQVQNGAPDGAGSVSSATIKLNGSDVFLPNDFNPHIPSLERPVSLRPTNTLEVRIASAPGSFLIVAFKAIRAQLVVVPDLPDPGEAPTMQAFPNPSRLPNIQLRALLIHRNGSSQDVTTLVRWASSDPAIGEVDATGFFRGLGQGRAFVTATLGTSTSPSLPIQTALIVKAASPNSAAAAMQELGSTDDPDLRFSIGDLITFELGPLGLATGAFREVFPYIHFHEMGLNAAGLQIPEDGATAVPGLNVNRNNPLNIFQWALVYDGNLHIVFKPATAADLKSRKFAAGEVLNPYAGTAIHELLHVIIIRAGIDAGSHDENEMLVGAVERLISTMWFLHRDPRVCGLISRLRESFPRIQTRKGAVALLERLGIVDSNHDGLPDQVRTDMCVILHGTVTNAITGAPLERATVETEEKQTSTNAFGEYLLTDLTVIGPPGRPYSVTAKASGFQPQTTNLVLTPGAVMLQNFALTPILQILDVSISAQVGASGSVRSTPAGINCTFTGGAQTGDCRARFPPGSVVRLQASPGGDSYFTGWSSLAGSCGTNPSCDVTVRLEGTKVGASFHLIPK